MAIQSNYQATKKEQKIKATFFLSKNAFSGSLICSFSLLVLSGDLDTTSYLKNLTTSLYEREQEVRKLTGLPPAAQIFCEAADRRSRAGISLL